jgi:hypothetical protein
MTGLAVGILLVNLAVGQMTAAGVNHPRPTLAVVATGSASTGQAPSATAPDRVLQSRRVVKAAMLACGLPAGGVDVRFEDDMQEDVVWVARRLTQSQMTCVAKASITTDYFVFFRDASEQRVYDPIYQKLSNEAEVANARDWLRARHLLAAVPTPEAGKPLSDYTASVEEFCGVKRGALLVAFDEHTITYTRGGLGRMTPKGIVDRAADDAQFDCILNATSAVDLTSHGIVFGFVIGGGASR